MPQSSMGSNLDSVRQHNKDKYSALSPSSEVETECSQCSWGGSSIPYFWLAQEAVLQPSLTLQLHDEVSVPWSSTIVMSAH